MKSAEKKTEEKGSLWAINANFLGQWLHEGQFLLNEKEQKLENSNTNKMFLSGKLWNKILLYSVRKLLKC